jgi:hypothetical protein
MKFRAKEARYLPPLLRDVEADEVFEVDENGPLKDWVKGLADQPYFEDITPATKKKD